MASKTSKPTGLSIKRDKAKFVTSWKRSGSDYGDGQQWQYKINNGSWKHHPNSSDSDISKTATDKTLSVDFDDYYPFVGSTPKLTKFSFRVRGNKKKSGSTNLGWSDWAEKSYTVNPPSKPSVTVETTENMTRFSWTVSTSDTNSKPFYRVLVYTALKQGFSGDTSENTDWTKIKDHPQAADLKSPVGSAFDKADLDDEMRAAYEAIGEGGMIYSSFEDSFWIRHKGQLIRVM